MCSSDLALSLLASATCDLVFMDVQMPEMDGLTATRKIRENEKQTGTHIPIVAMTAHAMKGDRERCLEAGMDGYITKPVSSREIEETIARIFRRAMPFFSSSKMTYITHAFSATSRAITASRCSSLFVERMDLRWPANFVQPQYLSM